MTSVQLTILNEDVEKNQKSNWIRCSLLIFTFVVGFTILLTINLLYNTHSDYTTKSFQPLSILYSTFNHTTFSRHPTNVSALPPSNAIVRVDVQSEDSLVRQNILYIQSWHDFLSIVPGGTLSHLPTRAACFARLHNYSYVLHMGNNLWKNNFQNRAQFANLTVTPSAYWMRLVIFISAFEKPEEIFDNSASPQSLIVRQKTSSQFDWVLYTDLDNAVVNSSVSLESLIERWQRMQNEASGSDTECWIFVQDATQIINTGWILIKRSVQAMELLYLWLDQWSTHGNEDKWVKDQGPFQESVLLWLSQNSDSQFHYEKNKCWEQGFDAHSRNLCYRDTMDSWNLPVYNRSYKGLCFLPEKEHVNLHFVHRNSDYFVHTNALKDVDKFKSLWHPTQGHFNHKAAMFNDPYCPLSGSVNHS